MKSNVVNIIKTMMREIEAMDDKKIIMLDGPVVEGTIVASLEAMMGTPLEELQAKVEESRYTKKLEG